MQVWNMLHAARWKYRMQKIAKNSPSAYHRTTLSGYIFATKARIDNRKKNLLNSNIFPTCLHNMVNLGPLAAEIGSVVWGNPANFNQFYFLASLLQRHRWLEANQTLHDIWPSPELVHYVYIFRGSSPLTEFCWVQNSFSLFCLGSVTGQHSSSGCQPNFAVLSRGCPTCIWQGGHHVGHWPTF